MRIKPQKMKQDNDLAHYLTLLCEISPNDQELGKTIRKHYGKRIIDDKEIKKD